MTVRGQGKPALPSPRTEVRTASSDLRGIGLASAARTRGNGAPRERLASRKTGRNARWGKPGSVSSATTSTPRAPPRLHSLAGGQRGITIRYDLLVPARLGLEFDALFDRCAAGDYRGINVTHPYKERAAARVRIDSPSVNAMGAVNTVVFEPDGPRGFNTDHTGFISAFRATFGAAPPGTAVPDRRGWGREGGRVRGSPPSGEGDPARGRRSRQGRGAGGGGSGRPPRRRADCDGDGKPQGRGPCGGRESSTAPRSAWSATAARRSRAR